MLEWSLWNCWSEADHVRSRDGSLRPDKHLLQAAAGKSSTACSSHFLSRPRYGPLSLQLRRHSTTTLHRWEGLDGRPSGRDGRKLDPPLGLDRSREPLSGRAIVYKLVVIVDGPRDFFSLVRGPVSFVSIVLHLLSLSPRLLTSG